MNSMETMVFLTGGTGVIGQQVLLGANAGVTEERAVPTYITGGPTLDYTQITIGQLGPELSDGWAYGLAAVGTPADVTPTAKVPMNVSWPDVTRYHCYFTAYAEMPHPDSNSHLAIISASDVLGGHSWWVLNTDAPFAAFEHLGYTPLYFFVGGQAGFFPQPGLDHFLSSVSPVPGYLLYPDGSGGARNDAHHQFEIGFDNLIGGLTFTKGVYDSNLNIYKLSPVTFPAFIQANNCTTKTVEAAKASGVPLQYEWIPQDFGIDLKAIPNP